MPPKHKAGRSNRLGRAIFQLNRPFSRHATGRVGLVLPWFTPPLPAGLSAKLVSYCQSAHPLEATVAAAGAQFPTGVRVQVGLPACGHARKVVGCIAEQVEGFDRDNAGAPAKGEDRPLTRRRVQLRAAAKSSRENRRRGRE